MNGHNVGAIDLFRPRGTVWDDRHEAGEVEIVVTGIDRDRRSAYNDYAPPAVSRWNKYYNGFWSIFPSVPVITYKPDYRYAYNSRIEQSLTGPDSKNPYQYHTGEGSSEVVTAYDELDDVTDEYENFYDHWRWLTTWDGSNGGWKPYYNSGLPNIGFHLDTMVSRYMQVDDERLELEISVCHTETNCCEKIYVRLHWKSNQELPDESSRIHTAPWMGGDAIIKPDVTTPDRGGYKIDPNQEFWEFKIKDASGEDVLSLMDSPTDGGSFVSRTNPPYVVITEDDMPSPGVYESEMKIVQGSASRTIASYPLSVLS